MKWAKKTKISIHGGKRGYASTSEKVDSRVK